MKRKLVDPFIITLVSVILLAYLFPQPGTKTSIFHLNEIADIGVSMIFLFYGVQLGPEKLKAGLSNFKLHIVIHVSTFILFPLLIILCKPLFYTTFLQEAWLPFFFLAALPSTVSSSVVMVSIAGGNIPAAIFNASISSLIGVFITPIWMSIFMQQNGNIELGSIISKLLLQVLLPLSVGLLLNKKFGKYAASKKKEIKLFDQTIILLIVYCSYCESFEEGVFKSFKVSNLVLLFAMATSLFILVYSIISVVSSLLHFSREDRITATFCGSKKSLIHGSVMSKILFTNATNSGLVLLPLMLFHGVQLFIISIIAGRMQRSNK